MIINLYFLVFFLAINPPLGQTRVENGHIEYSIIYEQEKKDDNGEGQYETEKNAVVLALSEIKGELFFNSERSRYVVKSILGKENDLPYKVARIMAGNEWFIYRNEQTKIERIRTMGEIFNVERPYETYDWAISNESKMIGNFKTFKATASFTEKNNFTNKTEDFQVKAWFCPDIHFPYGPKGVNGLPGLVLEVNFGSIIIRADRINLNIEKNRNLQDVPKNGIQISNEDFNELRRKRYSKKF
ncbi:GLPGLI family protein [Allomuricauda sp. CP2A]|jgi:GLPGLI family protein|uniref:GLPGLI family protein n=1 Tax=Allomuricauda sp. CP2A TaxID=1848189 RepID=UPI0008331E03|nr:GLPGLI family protein [Muricauda sp. CP2A]